MRGWTQTDQYDESAKSEKDDELQQGLQDGLYKLPLAAMFEKIDKGKMWHSGILIGVFAFLFLMAPLPQSKGVTSTSTSTPNSASSTGSVTEKNNASESRKRISEAFCVYGAESCFVRSGTVCAEAYERVFKVLTESF